MPADLHSRTQRLLARLLVAGLFAAASAAAADLRSPFPAPPQGHSAASYTCAPVPSPLRNIVANAYYADAASSVIDPALKRQNEASIKPLADFLRAFSRMTDHHTRTGSPDAASCALSWLDTWARAEALLGTMSSNQAEYHRKWALAGFALNYLKIRESSSLDAGRKARVEAWLRKLGYAVQPFFDDPRHKRNNHLYWVGLAAAAAGVASDERTLFDWGIGVYREALTQIAPDGTLRFEMDRRSRAVHYHNFALAPLVMIAELGAANGIQLYEETNGALHRLVARTVEGMLDPAYFERAARAKQEPAPRGGALAWAEPYLKRFPNAALPTAWKEQISHSRPLVYSTLGGDLTAVYASR